MPKINREEYEILKNVNKKCKWIARDKPFKVNRLGSIWVHEHKPFKDFQLYEWSANVPSESDDVNDNLFRFIEWEDDEPYNIQKLIEEYESTKYEIEMDDFLGELESFCIDTSKIKIEEPESEEKEVKKNLEWVRSIFENDLKWYSGVNDRTFIAKAEVFGYVLDKLDQLDEAETLSEEWISDNEELGTLILGETMNTNRFIQSSKLKDKLIPKQETHILEAYQKLREVSPLNDELFDYYWNVINDGAIDETKPLDNYEVLSPEWIDGHKDKAPNIPPVQNVVPAYKLKSLLLPKQVITEEQDRQKDWAEFTEFLAHERVFSHEDKEYIVVEKPVIPQFVADYFSDYDGNGIDLFDYILKYQWNEDAGYDDTLPRNVEDWIFKSDDNIVLALALSLGDLAYEVEQEPKYFVEDNNHTLLCKWESEDGWKVISTIESTEDEYDFYYADPDELKNLLVLKQEVAQELKEAVERLIEADKLAMDVQNLTGMTLEEIAEKARNGEFPPKQKDADQAYKDGYESVKLKLALGMEVEELEE